MLPKFYSEDIIDPPKNVSGQPHPKKGESLGSSRSFQKKIYAPQAQN